MHSARCDAQYAARACSGQISLIYSCSFVTTPADDDAVTAVPAELVSGYLRVAASQGNMDAIKELATAHSDLVNVADHLGFTPLHRACDNGHLGVAAALISRGATVNAASADGSTPLHCACAKDRPLIVKLLLKHGANPEIADNDGLMATHVAAPGAMAALPPLAQTPELS